MSQQDTENYVKNKFRDAVALCYNFELRLLVEVRANGQCIKYEEIDSYIFSVFVTVLGFDFMGFRHFTIRDDASEPTSFQAFVKLT